MENKKTMGSSYLIMGVLWSIYYGYFYHIFDKITRINQLTDLKKAQLSFVGFFIVILLLEIIWRTSNTKKEWILKCCLNLIFIVLCPFLLTHFVEFFKNENPTAIYIRMKALFDLIYPSGLLLILVTVLHFFDLTKQKWLIGILYGLLIARICFYIYDTSLWAESWTFSFETFFASRVWVWYYYLLFIPLLGFTFNYFHQNLISMKQLACYLVGLFLLMVVALAYSAFKEMIVSKTSVIIFILYCQMPLVCAGVGKYLKNLKSH